MALINCPECGRQVSDRANACPQCGNPIHTTSAAPQPIQVETANVVTTEATSKPWKGLQLLGVLITLLGMGSCISGNDPTSGATIAGVGGLVMIVGKLGAWWDHG